MSQGHLSDLIRLQWITRQDGAGSKPALVWCDDDLNDKTAIISHDLANNPASLPHKHISIETTMSPTGANPGELFTGWNGLMMRTYVKSKHSPATLR